MSNTVMRTATTPIDTSAQACQFRRASEPTTVTVTNHLLNFFLLSGQKHPGCGDL